MAKKAIERGYGAYFVRAYDLMEDLRKARIEHNLDRRMRVYLSPKVLVVDEFGIWPYAQDAATSFLILASARYERGSIILTFNKGFGEWCEHLGETVIAAAVLDRLLHHSHMLNIRGESYRVREKRQAGIFSSHHLLGTTPGNDNMPTDGVAIGVDTLYPCVLHHLIRVVVIGLHRRFPGIQIGVLPDQFVNERRHFCLGSHPGVKRQYRFEEFLTGLGIRIPGV